MLKLHLMGPQQIWWKNQDLSFRLNRKARALLFYLAAESDRPHHRQYLSAIFWPDLPESRAYNNLRQTLHLFRKHLSTTLTPPSPLLIEREAVSFDIKGPHWVDFICLDRASSKYDHLHASDKCTSWLSSISAILDRIQGPFLEGFSLPECEEFEIWVTSVREKLHAKVAHAIGCIVQYCERTGDIRMAIPPLKKYLAVEPLDEWGHYSLIRLLHMDGQSDAAIKQYQSCERIFRTELGILPPSNLQTLADQIRTRSRRSIAKTHHTRSGTNQSIQAIKHPLTVLYVECLSSSRDLDEIVESSDTEKDLIRQISILASRRGGIPVASQQDGAFMAYFGTGDSRECGALYGVQVACEIRQLFNDLPLPLQTTIQFRAALHCGLMVVHDSDSEEVIDPSGFSFRVAMGLCFQSYPGTITVSESVLPLLRNQFVLKKSAPFRVLGFSMAAWNIEGPSHTSQTEFFGGTPLFGREYEVCQLKELWSTNGRMALLLKGEAGVGKSSLIQSFCHYLQDNEVTVWFVNCLPQFADTPLYPIVQLFQQIHLPEYSTSADLYTHLHSYVCSLLHSDPDHAVSFLSQFSETTSKASLSHTSDMETFRERMEELFRDTLSTQAAQNSLLIVLEDLQWADDATIDLLGRILDDTDLERSASFLLTSRPDGLPDRIRSRWTHDQISLDPLGEECSRNLITYIDKGSLLPGEIVTQIVDSSGGIPLFISELTHQFLKIPAPNNRTYYPYSIKLPPTTHEILSARLDRVGQLRHFVQKAAIIGMEVPLDLLEEFYQDSLPLLEIAIMQVEKAGILLRPPSGKGKIRFCHALMHEVALQSIVRTDRIRFHREFAELLIERFPEKVEQFPEILAHHWAGAEEWITAIESFEKAALLAFHKGNPQGAEKYLLAGVRLLPLLKDIDKKNTIQDRIAIMLNEKLIPSSI